MPPPPSPGAAGSNSFEDPTSTSQVTSGASGNCDEASVSSPPSSVDPGPCGFDFDSEIAALLEAQWPRDGSDANTNQLRTAAASEMNPASE